ncbi:FMN-dependent dehydrogenase [Dothidotthia symphoricarpi CBS 119687]|uniref:Oxidase FUB9 n=1 Tax=Dothidotthia symphoricarpi CBS 119687 TaxID=1392245 RepID=A0A6A5ZWD2_9PLEO|nr:FMN-dependent dehydrogenase [Dothidotthia symphoricarpi CBS 119687]KAF2123839.1 FMN-dependent dehydrogenase [Dothidotthia symphoricarpi CBS 119687]
MANRPINLDSHVFSIRDLEEIGTKHLQAEYRDYFNGGAMDMVTLRDNVSAYDRYKICPRVLRNVSSLDTSAEIFGTKITFPCGLSPSAMHRLAHPDGELATSRAAAKMSIPLALSSYSTTSLEDVKAQGNGNPYMMQMCIVKDRNITLQLLSRAEQAGYQALFLSVDVPVLGRRLGEMRTNFVLPENLSFPNLLSNGADEFLNADAKVNGPQAFDDTLEWEEIVPWLRKHTSMQIWLKGILSPEDVEQAVAAGVDGVIISNHGGRQLDGVPATLDALRQCAPIAKGRVRIAVDGGIRRGSDIFKAIALGAEFCFLGRIAIWGLAYKGQSGVELGIRILLEEFRSTMALAGCRSVNEITSSHLCILENNGILSKL